MTSHPGKRITIYDQEALFGAAYLHVATMDKAVNGFRSTGLWPYNQDIFSENDFMAAAITDEPIPLQQSQPATHPDIEMMTAITSQSPKQPAVRDDIPPGSIPLGLASISFYRCSTKSDALDFVRHLSPIPHAEQSRTPLITSSEDG
jgi:hypothetical protein